MLRILLAEDDAAMRTYLQRALEKADYAVTSVDRGTAALPLLRRGQHPHLVVAARARCHQGMETDGAGQHEAVVVVGVLADQVDAPGCTGHQARGPAEALLEGRAHA